MRSYWSLALGVSILVHSLILSGISPSWFKKRNIKNKEEAKAKEIEILPKEIEKINKEEAREFEQVKVPPPCVDDLVQKIMVQEDSSLPLDKPNVLVDNTKEIILSDIPQDKNLKKIPAYMDYYRLVRERIRKNAYRHYTINTRGEILLTFVVSRDGGLKDSYLNERSVKSSVLRKIVLKSIKEAAPFPPFPEELKDYVSLQFNISIYFKNN